MLQELFIISGNISRNVFPGINFDGLNNDLADRITALNTCPEGEPFAALACTGMIFVVETTEVVKPNITKAREHFQFIATKCD
jgi:hypothetical protein